MIPAKKSKAQDSTVFEWCKHYFDRREFMRIIGALGTVAALVPIATVGVQKAREAYIDSQSKLVNICGEDIVFLEPNGHPAVFWELTIKSDDKPSLYNNDKKTKISWAVPRCGLLNVESENETVFLSQTEEIFEDEIFYINNSFTVTELEDEKKVTIKATYDDSVISDESAPKHMIKLAGESDAWIDPEELITPDDAVLTNPKYAAALDIINNKIVGESKSIVEVIRNIQTYLGFDENQDDTHAQILACMNDVEILANGKAHCTGHGVLTISCLKKFFKKLGFKNPPHMQLVKTRGFDGSTHIEVQIETATGKFFRFDPAKLEGDVFIPTGYPLGGAKDTDYIYGYGIVFENYNVYVKLTDFDEDE